MAKRYTYLFYVRQRAGGLALSFPIDMMRYDACRPASEQDSGAITRTFDAGAGKSEPVQMRSDCTENRHWEPTAGRWDSFGWEVVPNSLQRKER